jgi:hypothetical protein
MQAHTTMSFNLQIAADMKISPSSSDGVTIIRELEMQSPCLVT